MFAVHRGFRAHADAKAWLDDRLSGSDRVGLPWGALLAFIRVSASTKIMSRPLPLPDAVAVAQGWLSAPSTWVPEPTERHAEVLASLLDGETKADLVPDAHLAALAIEHGLTLCSTDRDYSRFEGLRWTNPLR